MTKIFATKGLPASGKTTAALEACKDGSAVRANRDDIRFQLFGKYWGKGVDEKQVSKVQDEIVADAVRNGIDVWIDDTNLSPKAQAHILALSSEHGVEVEWVDFTDVSPLVCIERDSKRERQVGAKVIWDMWEKNLKPEHPGDPSLPHAVLFDVDGTLALHMDRRGPFEWTRVGEDDINPMVVKLAKLLAQDHVILVVSGRDAVCRPETTQWLIDNEIPFTELLMRPEGDMRKDAIVKLEILEDIKTRYFPALCVDDRQQVVDAYRSVGLPVWQVARGDF